MRGIHAVIMLGLCLLAPAAHAQVDLEPFLKQDMIGTLKISPGGEYYAVTVPQEDRTILTIVRRSDKRATAQVVGIKHSLVSDFWWVNPERVVVSMAEKSGSEDQPYATGELHAVNADASGAKMLFGRYGLHGEGDVPQLAFMVDALAEDDRHILVSTMVAGYNPLTRVEKIDVYTRKRTTVAMAPVHRARFATDAAGVVRFAQGWDVANRSKLYYRENDAAEWRLLNDETVSGRVEWPLGFSEDAKTAYLQSEMASGPDAIIGMELATGARQERLRDKTVDPLAIIYRSGDRVPEGSFLMHERVRTQFFDAQSATARLYRKLEKAFPNEAVRVTSATADGRLLVVQRWSDRNPGDFYLFDTTSNRADLIFSQRGWFEPERMAPTRAIAFKARDGLPLHGYLTVPQGAKTEHLPLVVIPHGGPFGVFDEWGFDGETQLLTEAGYAVLRVNFRGSGNYGRAFLQAGARQWGRAMQDDLTDATHWAVAQKVADPNRICLYGASYGGYASLMGVAREPALYRCAVGYVGVYDLPLMHKQDSATAKWMRNWAADWLGERDALDEVSPTTLAAQIRAPIFLAAGGEDSTAPIAHSKRMEKSLKAAGVPVETLYYDTEGHGFYTVPHRREFYTRLLDFLSRHIGGQKAR
jgi:dipeptidyl aminopeptidase/acylaminoacyl peptidase